MMVRSHEIRFQIRFLSWPRAGFGLLAVASSHDGAVGQASAARPWLGVELEQQRAPAAGPESNKGVRVRHTVRSSPAWNAGVRDGDVIVRIGDVKPSRPDDVIREVAGPPSGVDGQGHIAARRGRRFRSPATCGHAPRRRRDAAARQGRSAGPQLEGAPAVSGPLPAGHRRA